MLRSSCPVITCSFDSLTLDIFSSVTMTRNGAALMTLGAQGLLHRRHNKVCDTFLLHQVYKRAKSTSPRISVYASWNTERGSTAV